MRFVRKITANMARIIVIKPEAVIVAGIVVVVEVTAATTTLVYGVSFILTQV